MGPQAVIAYLDTNVVLRLVSGEHGKLTQKARKAINVADLFVSPMVDFELQYLYEIKRLRITSSEILEKLHAEAGIAVCQRAFSQTVAVAKTLTWTRDPFDRIIVANAMLNGVAPLITSDELVLANYVNAVW